MTRRTRTRVQALLPSLVMAGAVSLPAGAALADGVVLRPADLGAARATLEARVAAERRRSPTLFEAVAALSRAPGKGSRSQRPAAVGVTLRRMGTEGRWAIAELVALSAPSRASLGDKAFRALQIAAVDALSVAPDPELAPVLRASFERAAEPGVQAAAATGLGRLGDAELPLLLTHAVPGDARFVAAVEGLGESRRPRAVLALAELLDRTSDEAAARTIVAALGEAGSSWAWSSGSVGSAADGEVVRRAAASALVRNAARLPETTTDELRAAVRRVDHPETPALVAAARAATPAAQLPRLDRLLVR